MANELTRFGVSRNILAGLVRPLLKSSNLVNRDPAGAVLSHLRSIHASLWARNNSPGRPPGQILELQMAFTYAVTKGCKVSLGEESGGDFHVVNAQGFKTTYQAKGVYTADRNGISEHIAKAAHQLSGATGENPQSTQGRVAYLRIAGAFPFEPGEFTELVKQSFASGYATHDENFRTPEELYQAVNEVQVEENGYRHRYIIPSGPDQAIRYVGCTSVPNTTLGSAADVVNHWRALCLWVHRSSYDPAKTSENGCCSGPQTPPVPPWERADGITVDYAPGADD